jgi:hypothetical protein
MCVASSRVSLPLAPLVSSSTPLGRGVRLQHPVVVKPLPDFVRDEIPSRSPAEVPNGAIVQLLVSLQRLQKKFEGFALQHSTAPAAL